jgi:hypothetical protein
VSQPSLAAWDVHARRPHGIAAVLLPYTPAGAVDRAAFERHVTRTRDAGLDVAVNMDTGFGDLLTPAERDAVLDATRAALGPGPRFYAGAFALGAADPRAAYRYAIAASSDAVPCRQIVQCHAMRAMEPAEKAALYADVARATAQGALAFELSPRCPHGEIWDDESFERLLDVPQLITPISVADRALELRRLATRTRAWPSWRVYTSTTRHRPRRIRQHHLLGLATFAPERFAERDAAPPPGRRLPRAQRRAQHLGNVGFRADPRLPAPRRAVPPDHRRPASDAIHRRAPRRPAADRALLHDCALRLGMLDDPDYAWREFVAPYLGAT